MESKPKRGGGRDSMINPKTGKRYGWEAEQAARKAAEPDLEEVTQRLGLLKRAQRAQQAREKFMPFVKFTSPDPADPNDVDKSRYQNARHHDAIARVIEEVVSGGIRFLILTMPPRHGKQLSHDTLVPTPAGYVRHGDLRPGDTVFGPDGLPVRVLAIGAEASQDMEVEFTNGEVVRCHEKHEWTVRDRRAYPPRTRTLETRDLECDVWIGKAGSRGGRARWQLPDAACLSYPSAVQPLHPYALGVWLGDGATTKPHITGVDEEVFDAVAACSGFHETGRWVHKATGVTTVAFSGPRPNVRGQLSAALHALGLVNAKFIPPQYLRASKEQRLQLLAGLMDTDGHVERGTGRCRFVTGDERLADDVFTLASGLGFRPYITRQQPSLSTSGIQGRREIITVGFQPSEDIPTRLERKRVLKFGVRRRVAIKSIRRIAPHKGRCIQVDRPDGLYIVGRRHVVTHNSELVSRRLPAWFIGKFPHQNGVVATYNDDFASDFGKDVRAIVGSPQFKQVFPGVRLQRGGAASDFLKTTEGGQWAFVGRGGSLTGRGAHCLAEGTTVETNAGPLPIERVTTAHKVLSYETGTGSLVWKAVKAVAVRPRSRVFRVATSAGRVVEATCEHRFYANGSWAYTDKLAPGDRLVCAVRNADDALCGGREQAFTPRAQAVLLLDDVHRQRPERHTVWRAGVCALRGVRPEEGRRWNSSKEPHILLARVHGSGSSGRIRDAGVSAHEALRSLQRDVHTGECDGTVLQSSMRVESARGGNGRRGEPEVEGRGVREPREAACYETLSRIAAYGDEARWAEVRSMPECAATRSSSRRRESLEQSRDEFDNVVSSLPRESAFFSGSTDFVRSVEDTGRDALVYDIQVDETECFFANGVLVHNCLIIDDLIKDDKEAQSQAIRDQAWNWFTKVAMSRRMGLKLVIMTFTRWHSDDPIGRLTDPENPYYNENLARKIKIINLPAIAEEDDPLGREPGEALWPDGPDKFDLDFLEEQRSIDALGFEALYQQHPSLLDGELYRRETIKFYGPGTGVELPTNLRYYAASDHALDSGRRHDPSCLLKIGVDKNSDIYILDCIWKKMPTDVAVEAMLAMMRDGTPPLLWWAEKGHISKSIGPFLRKRMLETGTYINIVEVTPVSDKGTRAQSMVGRVAMGKVYFPKGAWWTEKAINEMMAFPNGTHDDFCDTLSLFGLGLQNQFAPSKSVASAKTAAPAFGTLAWVRQADTWHERQRAERTAGGF